MFLLHDKGKEALPYEGKGRYIYKFDANLNFMYYYFIHSTELDFMQFAGEDKSGGVYYYGSFQDSIFYNSQHKLYEKGPTRNGYIVKYTSDLNINFTINVSGMVPNYFTVYYPNNNFVSSDRVAINLYGINYDIDLFAKNGTQRFKSNGSNAFNNVISIDTAGYFISKVTINLDGQTPLGSCPIITTNYGSIVYVNAYSPFKFESMPKKEAGFCYLLLDEKGELRNYYYQKEGLSQPFLARDTSFYIGGQYNCLNDSFNADFFNSVTDGYKLKCPNNNNFFLGKYKMNGAMEWNRPTSGFVRAFSIGTELNLLLETMNRTDVDLSNEEHWINPSESFLFSKYDCKPISYFTVQSGINNHIKFYFNGDLSSNWEWDFGDGTTSRVVNPKHIYANKGKYSPKLICKNKCGSDTFSIDLNFDSDHVDDIKEIEEIGISVFPNPTTGMIKLIIEKYLGYELDCFNLMGQNVNESKPLRIGENLINLSQQPNGVYILEIKRNGVIVASKKVLLQK